MAQGLTPRFRRGPERPLILGHRGASEHAPENTMAAFDLALEQGADGVELDVRLNRSGDVVVVHDVDLSRVTEGRLTQRVEDLTSAECAELRLAGSERLPTLRQVLRWAAERGALVNVELKCDGRGAAALPRAVARELVSHSGAASALLISSFSPRLVLQHRWLCPEVAAAWLFSSSWVARSPWLPPADAVHPHFAAATPRRVQRWHRQGLRVHCWTVNLPEQARQLSSFGVDALIGNSPQRLLQALSS